MKAGKVDIVSSNNVLRAGGVLLYPTEGVWGLGCDPWQQVPVQKILALKQRPMGKGLILLVADLNQLNGLVRLTPEEQKRILETTEVVTWVAPASSAIPAWIRGDFTTVAFRVTKHEIAREICRIGPIVSTSANLSGDPAPCKLAEVAPEIIEKVDLVIHGECGALRKPTPIYDLTQSCWLRR